jgi:hypothetical protein
MKWNYFFNEVEDEADNEINGIEYGRSKSLS